MLTTHVALVPLHAPVHPVNRLLLAAAAVSITPVSSA
jgi:hypothetical protein